MLNILRFWWDINLTPEKKHRCTQIAIYKMVISNYVFWTGDNIWILIYTKILKIRQLYKVHTRFIKSTQKSSSKNHSLAFEVVW